MLGGAKELSDAEVEALRTELYDLAQFFADAFGGRSAGSHLDGLEQEARRALIALDDQKH